MSLLSLSLKTNRVLECDAIHEAKQNLLPPVFPLLGKWFMISLLTNEKMYNLPLQDRCMAKTSQPCPCGPIASHLLFSQNPSRVSHFASAQKRGSSVLMSLSIPRYSGARTAATVFHRAKVTRDLLEVTFIPLSHVKYQQPLRVYSALGQLNRWCRSKMSLVRLSGWERRIGLVAASTTTPPPPQGLEPPSTPPCPKVHLLTPFRPFPNLSAAWLCTCPSQQAQFLSRQRPAPPMALASAQPQCALGHICNCACACSADWALREQGRCRQPPGLLTK